MLSTPARSMWLGSPGIRRAWVALTSYNVMLGCALLVGGPDRISGPSFTAMRELGGHIPWGLAFVLVGVLLASGATLSRRAMFIILSVAGATHFFLMLCLASAVPLTDSAALTGIPTYLAVAFWHVSQAEIYRSGES